MNIIAATKNKGKIREIEEIFGELGINVISQDEAGITIDAEESGNSFKENALIKARAAAMFTNDIVMADDSGLCVEALDGRPGIFSARYGGEETSYEEKMKMLIKELEGEKNRRAKFVAYVAMVFPDGSEVTAKGEIDGIIMDEPKGTNGFGYDPIFYCPELKKGFAEATDEEKNKVSHRARALHSLYEKVKNILE